MLTTSNCRPAASPWADYLSTQAMPVLIGLMYGASENDRTILTTIYDTLLNSELPGADAADTVENLWTTYTTVYSPTLNSRKILITLDRTLYSAKQYIEHHH